MGVVIYGASGGGIKVLEMLRSVGIDIDFWVDSNEEKWGNYVLGKVILNPKCLQKTEHKIIIASDANYTTILKSLQTLGLEDKCVLREELLKPAVAECCDVGKTVKEYNANSSKSVFVEMLEGFQIGGVANWSLMLVKGLKRKNVCSSLLSKKNDEASLEWKENEICFKGDYIDFKECIEQLVNFLEKRIPCVLVLNKQLQLYYAGCILKKKYPNDVTMCSVVHSDLQINYIRQNYIQDDIDIFFGVSKKIIKQLECYGIDRKKIKYKETPVDFSQINNKIYNKNGPIKIGYAAKLEKMQKRADLIIPFIQNLENENVEYKLFIAGEGRYRPIINSYIKKQNLEDKVRVLGNISHDKMFDFWNYMDVFVNLSESEGTPIAMLEAMYCKNVPLVFDISGSRDFIKNEENGYIFSFGCINEMVKKIRFLSQNKELCFQLGNKAGETIRKKCNYDDYIAYFIKLFS